ncbi:MAG TPA: hypothetical protein VGH27_02085 [Streptosporangiaceae bacterium]|jgi:hypothetical protein
MNDAGSSIPEQGKDTAPQDAEPGQDAVPGDDAPDEPPAPLEGYEHV